MDKTSRICIIGPGAVGGVIVGVLTREEYHPVLVAKYPDLAQKISSQGIQGKELNVDTPVNEQLTHMIRKIEQGKRQITPENLKEISYK